ncbi:hypothetical protein [Paraglaciecola sp. 25GB23A]|uniref:DUF6942 family protein n=1 Tax=Paraglaciecola sp. 25GB23A TaxID=3156068 RepID=UPI0032AF7CFC
MFDITGLGDESAKIRVYIGNRPSYRFARQDNSQQDLIFALIPGEIRAIGLACGNGWRKVFNVYAKLMYALPKSGLNIPDKRLFTSWQNYRDQQLLQEDSNTALCFAHYELRPAINGCLNLIMGKTYAKSLNLPANLVWLDNEFAIAPEFNLIVCPYFDYRQLSNNKIIRLVELIEEVMKKRH